MKHAKRKNTSLQEIQRQLRETNQKLARIGRLISRYKQTGVVDPELRAFFRKEFEAKEAPKACGGSNEI
jgi:hypothetical protein